MDHLTFDGGVQGGVICLGDELFLFFFYHSPSSKVKYLAQVKCHVKPCVLCSSTGVLD